MGANLAGGAASIPPPWYGSGNARDEFLQRIAEAQPLSLICDYDGTLAPFQQDKMQAFPYSGVKEVLARIAGGRTKLSFVSGRPIAELLQLLPIAATVEVWGMHGREHRAPGGAYRRIEPTAGQQAALDKGEEVLRKAGLGSLVERKIGSVALHWRTLAGEADQGLLLTAKKAAKSAFASHAGQHRMALLPFDGGLELRAEDHTKAHAVESMLAGMDAGGAAFLGDDTTDEDAFQAIRGAGGLGILVREPARPSFAAFALRPPDELLRFLEDWSQAAAV